MRISTGSGTDPGTPGWTTTAFDKIGRPVTVGSYSGAVPPAWGNTSPTSGSTVIVYDQTAAGTNNLFNSVCDQQSARFNFVDGLGRLASVTEDPSGFTCTPATTKVNAVTSYAYSVLDDVITVTQSSVTGHGRRFAFCHGRG